MPITEGSTKLAREELLSLLETLPAEHFDGPTGQRIPPGDACYLDWLLATLRTFTNAVLGVSELMHLQGGDEELRELGPYGYVERWRVNQVLFYYHNPLVELLLQQDPQLVEADLAPARLFANRRQGALARPAPHMVRSAQPLIANGLCRLVLVSGRRAGRGAVVRRRSGCCFCRQRCRLQVC
jgi:hypothetical protein